MRKAIPRSARRVGVAVNYAALLAVVVLAYLARATGPHMIITLGIGAVLLLLFLTWFRYHLGTGLWKLAHINVERLDERERQVTHEALRHAYAVFTVISLMILLWKSLFQDRDSNLIIIFAALLYLSHTLPSAILAWTEQKDYAAEVLPD